MLQLLLSWMYIFINVFILATGIKVFLKRVLKADIKDYDILLLLAIAMLTVYAQFFSLFSKLGLAANLFMILINTAIAWISRNEIRRCLYSFGHKKHRKMVAIFFIGLTIVMLANSCGPNVHVDTELYHGQAVRWMEEYSAVKGLGNIFRRSAYNSSFLCLQALFSFKFVFGQSIRNMNGFCSLLMFGIVLSTLKIWDKKQFFASDLLKLIILLMSAVTDSFTSVNTDLFAMELGVYIFAKWLSCMEDDDKEPIRYSLLSILVVYATTLKLSAAFMIVFVILPAYLLIKEKRWKEICICIMGG